MTFLTVFNLLDLISYSIEKKILHIMTKKVYIAVAVVKFNHSNFHFVIEKRIC